MFKNKSTKFIIFEIIIMMIGVIGITLAVSYVMNSVNINVDTANLAIDYTGNLTLPSVNLVPILDSEVESNTENVMRINFSVKGASTNPNIPIIYDVILSDLVVDTELKSEYVKWELEKNGTVISNGSLDPWFDSIRDGKFWLTEIQQDLVRSSGTADNYEFRLWISEACTGDITTCTEDMDQSNMLNKSISGKIEVVLYTKGKEALERKPGMNAAEYIPTLLSSNPNTMNNDDPVGNVRYMGANPNNYVRFNNKLWRIIGVFDVASTYGGPTEKRLKIIRNDSIGNMEWDSGNVNDWTQASLQEYLNGDYYNSIDSVSQNLIGDTYWNLGGTASYTSASNGLPSHFYGYERGTTVYSGRPTYWVGKIGLMYPSDYGYATSGGSTTNRASCLAKEMYNWDSSSYSDCKNNDYLYNSSYRWTITPDSSDSGGVFRVYTAGYVGNSSAYSSGISVSPVLYLKSTVQITGGEGTSENPFTLSQ